MIVYLTNLYTIFFVIDKKFSWIVNTLILKVTLTKYTFNTLYNNILKY